MTSSHCDIITLWHHHCVTSELGANLAGANGGAEEEVVTSGVSSANSAGKPLAYKKMVLQELYKDYDKLQEDNLR